MTTVDPQINDLMTTAQIRQIRQRLEEERMRPDYGSLSHQGGYPDEYNRQRQHAYTQRQELLDRIKLERKLRDELTDRPFSHSGRHSDRRRRRRTPEPSPRRAASEPPTERKGNTTPRQILEHQIRPVRLEPLDPPSVTQYVQPTPILLNPMQQHNQIPAAPPHPPPVVNTKAEMMEMMMLQNAQMHQVIMNQMMMSNLPKGDNSRTSSRAVDIDDLVRRRPPSVHHHHYDNQPARTLPPLQVPAYPYPAYQSPRYYPAEMEPLHPPRDYPSTLHQYYHRDHPSRTEHRH